MRITVIDDVKYDADLLARKIRGYPFEIELEVAVYTSCVDFIKKNTSDVDIFFLDIELKTEDGIRLGTDLSTNLRDDFPRALFVFVSTFDDYYRDAAKAGTFAFLEKPIKEEELHTVITRAIRSIKSREEWNYTIMIDRKRWEVDLSQVLYISYKRRYYTFYFQNDEVTFFSKKTVNEMYDEVSAKYRHLGRITNNLIVNYNKTIGYSQASVSFEGVVFLVSGKYKYSHKKQLSKLMEKYKLYM